MLGINLNFPLFFRSVDDDAPGGDKDESGRSSPRKVSHQSLDGAARQEDESNA